ncbi:MAG TPA: hypothetical protein DCF33_17365 [Saprospirales bacterium]|nr:hypothetical protein [Saprospirales bacterium]
MLKTFGEQSAAYGKVCHHRGRTLYYKDDNTEAEQWALKALEIREKVLGKENADYAGTLNLLANVYRYTKVYDKAEPMFQEAIKIRATVLGKEHPDYISSLSNLARMYISMKVYSKAEALYSEVLEIKTKLHGTESLEYAKALTDVANMYYNQRKYTEALPMYLKTLNIRGKILGKEHPDYTATIIDLADSNRMLGEYENAIALYDEALEINRKLSGGKTTDFAMDLNQLANLVSDMDNYPKAESIYLEALGILASNDGKETMDYATVLENLGILYKDIGAFNKVEPLYLESIRIREIVIGKEDARFANSLENLANFYLLRGNIDKAEKLYLESKDIREKTLGKEHKYYAFSLYNLAVISLEKGDSIKAEQLLLEAIQINAKALGKDHPDYALSLQDLADLYRAKGAYDKAETLYLEADKTIADKLGTEHSSYAYNLCGLAQIYQAKGAYTKAEPFYLQAKNAIAKTLGKVHPRYGQVLSLLAIFYQKTNRIAESTTHYLELIKLDRQLIENAARYSAENEMIQYMGTFQDDIAQFQSFSQAHPSPELCRESFNNALFFNGLTLDNSRLLAHAIAGADSLTRGLYEKWQNCHRRLAKRYARPIEERKKIAEVEAEAEGYEKQLMRSLPVFQQTRYAPHWQQVRDQLKPNEAAVEFIHFRYCYPDRSDSIFYAALLLRPGWEAPRFIPLFEEKQLDSLLNTHGDRKADYVANLYSMADRGIITLEKPAKSLFELIWKPLETALGSKSGVADSVKTVFFSPTGLLHRINLAAIPVNTDSILADQYHLIELGSTRQLMARAKTTFDNSDAILFGGIQFEMDSNAIFAANTRLQNADLASRGPVEDAYTDAASRGESWNYLKWTEKEVNGLAPILSSGGIFPEIRKGFDATEEAFKTIGTNGNSPRILHLATHGFFFPDLKDAKPTDTQETGFKTSNNPLIRSGLLLAGANHAWKTGKPLKKGMENGILTAYEISHMNLSNTELVVLSACETGLGDIQGNEGVYGLQRAFKIAGVKYLIMSLWQVPDRETAEFMTTFYEKWLTNKMSIPEAFLMTQKEMRERFINPYSWAGFVLLE